MIVLTFTETSSGFRIDSTSLFIGNGITPLPGFVQGILEALV